MSAAKFICPCCGHETAVPASADDVVSRFNGVSRELIEALSKGRWMSRDALFNIIYGHRADGGPEGLRVISVRMYQLRKQLAPLGYTIDSAARGGSRNGAVYRLAPIIQGEAS